MVMRLETHAFPDASSDLSHIATTSYRYTTVMAIVTATSTATMKMMATATRAVTAKVMKMTRMVTATAMLMAKAAEQQLQQQRQRRTVDYNISSHQDRGAAPVGWIVGGVGG